MWQVEKELVLYCDGSCIGVGPYAIGHYAYVAYHGRQKILGDVGQAGSGVDMTVNVAEYLAVLRGMKALAGAGYTNHSLRVCGDSKVVMQQLSMLCAVRSQRLLPCWRAVREMVHLFDVHFEWIPRAFNRETDRMLREYIHVNPGQTLDETP